MAGKTQADKPTAFAGSQVRNRTPLSWKSGAPWHSHFSTWIAQYTQPVWQEAYFFSKLSMYSFFFLLLSWAEICNGRGDERITLQLLSVRDNRGWDGGMASSEFQEELTSELDNKTINPSSLSEPMGGAQGQVSHMVVSWLLWKIPSAGPETHRNHSVSPLCPSYQVTIIKPCMEHTGHRDTWILVKDVRARIDEIVRGLRKPTGNMITPRPPPLLFFCPLFSVCLFLLKYNMSKY